MAGVATAVSPLAPAAFSYMPEIGGVRFATAEAGIKHQNRRDVLLMLFDKGTTVAKGGDDKKDGDSKHSGWWCDEHGVQEAECSMCSAKVAKAFQDKGDWCKDHDRPDSQCFACHPEYEAAFAARYEAKMGSKPPKPSG